MAGYTIEELSQALIRADAAGDTQAAQRLAAEIRALQGPQAGATQETSSPKSKGFGESVLRGGGQFLSGVNEGLATIAGAPVDLMRGALNYGIDGVNYVAGADIDQLPPGYGGSKQIKGALSDVGAVTPVDTEFKTSRKVGDYTGMGLGTVLTGGALAPTTVGATRVGQILSAPTAHIVRNPASGLAKTLVGETAASGGAVAGEKYGEGWGAGAGENIAELVGADAETGQQYGASTGKTLGGLLGALAPTAATGVAVGGLKTTLGHPNSEKIYDALVSQNMTPSPGLVGNKAASFLENATANVPVVGAPALLKQRRQNRQFGDAVEDIAGFRRGHFNQLDPIDEASVGNKIATVADAAAQRIRKEIDRRETALERKIGPNTPVDVSGTRRAIKQQIPHTDARLADGLSAEARNLERNTVPRHATLRGLLMADKRALAKQLERTKPGTEQHARLQTQLAGIEAKILKNQQVPWEKMRDYRSGVGKSVDGTQGLPRGHRKGIYAGVTRDADRVAQDTGHLDEWKRLQGDERRWLRKNETLDQGGDVPYLEKLAGKEGGEVYNHVITGGRQNWERLDALKRNVKREEWDDISADVIDRMGRASEGDHILGGEFSPAKFLTNWQKLSERSKTLLFDSPVVRRDMNELAAAASGFKARGRAGNPSGTASSLMIGAGGLATGAGLMTSIPATAGVATGIAATSGAVSSTALARIIAGKHPGIAERLLRRLPGRAAAATNEALAQDPEDQTGVSTSP